MSRELTPQEAAERSLIKKYRKELWNPFIAAVKRYELIAPGDRIAVCISGGKDSMVLAKLMQELQRHTEQPFELVFLLMGPGYAPANRALIEENAARLGIPITVFRSDIFDVAYQVEKNPCYLCARMRRGFLYSKAQELGCNKIALGHHLSDVLETTLLGLFYGAQLQTMPPKLRSRNFPGMELIRPLYCVHEDAIIAWKNYNGLRFLQCACRFTERCATCGGEKGSKRDEMKELIAEAKKRGIRILMDLVVNHSSDRHAWFQAALKDPFGKYGKYYVFREGKDGKEPNNWRSIFGGSAWEKVPGYDKLYYLHIFTKEQPDLNWENQELREEIYEMILKWMDLGLGGFRLDAISHLKKNYQYTNLPPDGPDEYNMAFEYFNNVDGLADILREMKERTFAPTDALTIGEYDHMGPEDVEDVIGENGSFSSVFDFCHTLDNVRNPKWGNTVALFDDYRDQLFAAQKIVDGRGMLCNFLENHDKPRSIDRFLMPEDQNLYSEKMLPVTNFFLPGIVFLYQGQEIGMRDDPKQSIQGFVDKPTFAIYDRLIAEGKTDAEALEQINRESREHSRTPMQWDASAEAGFTTGTPWFPVNKNYTELNYEAEEKDPDSLLWFYRKMVAVRRREDLEETFLYGTLIPEYETVSGVLAYRRKDEKNNILILTTSLADGITLPFTGTIEEVLLNNYDTCEAGEETIRLQPYQCLVLKVNK